MERIYTNRNESLRRMLFIWGSGEILLAIGLVFFWHAETGILYLVRGLIFSILFLSGLLCIKDGFFASNLEISKKMGIENVDEENIELTKKDIFVGKLKKIHDKYPGAFAVAVVIFGALYISNIYIPGKTIIEIILIVVIVILGIPVLIFWDDKKSKHAKKSVSTPETTHKRPFLFLQDIAGEFYTVFLVNPTDQKYTSVKKLTGAFTSMGDDLLETSKAVFDFPGVNPHSHIQIDDIEWRERDFTVWYQLDLILEGGSTAYLGGSVPKYLDSENKEFVEFGIGKEGWVLALTERPDAMSIDETIKAMHMESRYITFDENIPAPTPKTQMSEETVKKLQGLFVEALQEAKDLTEYEEKKLHHTQGIQQTWEEKRKQSFLKKEEILRDEEGYPLKSHHWTDEEIDKNPHFWEGLMMSE